MSAPLETLKSVTRRFSDHFGCQVREIESDLWELQLPKALQQKFRSGRWVLCFHRDLLGADPESQLVTAGSPVLQRMREALEAEGLVAETSLQPQVPAPAGVPPELRALNGTLRLQGHEQLWKTLVRFHFRLTLGGTERHEEFFPVVLDSESGACAEATLKRALDLAAPQPGAAGAAALPNRDRLLDLAFQEAECRAAPLVVELEDLQDRAARAELAEADDYFRESLREADAERGVQLQEFQAARLAEIRERHQVHAELEPRGAVLFRLPRTRLDLVLEDGAHRAPLRVYLDQLEGILTAPSCRLHPDRNLRQVGLCPDHGLHCEACHWTCASCSRVGCLECGGLDCPDCGGRHCQGCTALCAACSSPRGSAHLADCSSGCGPVCGSCRVDVGNRPCCCLCAAACDCGHGELQSRIARSTASNRTYCRTCAAQHLAACALGCGLVEAATMARCSVGGERVCPKCRRALSSGGVACLKHAADCACGRTVLRTELTLCGTHGSSCPICRWTCATCGQERCPQCKTGKCGFCDQAHCRNCITSCRTCSAPVALSHLVLCPNGCGVQCPNCLVVVRHEAGRGACRSCAVLCARCGGWELRDQAGQCGFCPAPLCRTCRKEAETCTTCGRVACNPAAHLRECVGRHKACLACTGTCHICRKPNCNDHGDSCLDCSRRTCKGDLAACRLCGENLCAKCLDDKGRCALCKRLVPLRDKAQGESAAALIRRQGRALKGFSSVHKASSRHRTLYVFGWFLGGQEFYSLDLKGAVLKARRRGALARLTDSSTEPLP